MFHLWMMYPLANEKLLKILGMRQNTSTDFWHQHSQMAVNDGESMPLPQKFRSHRFAPIAPPGKSSCGRERRLLKSGSNPSNREGWSQSLRGSQPFEAANACSGWGDGQSLPTASKWSPGDLKQLPVMRCHASCSCPRNIGTHMNSQHPTRIITRSHWHPSPVVRSQFWWNPGSRAMNGSHMEDIVPSVVSIGLHLTADSFHPGGQYRSMALPIGCPLFL